MEQRQLRRRLLIEDVNEAAFGEPYGYSGRENDVFSIVSAAHQVSFVQTNMRSEFGCSFRTATLIARRNEVDLKL